MEQLDHLKNLVIMAAADGSLSEQEIALLIDRCATLGLDEEDLEKAIHTHTHTHTFSIMGYKQPSSAPHVNKTTSPSGFS